MNRIALVSVLMLASPLAYAQPSQLCLQSVEVVPWLHEHGNGYRPAFGSGQLEVFFKDTAQPLFSGGVYLQGEWKLSPDLRLLPVDDELLLPEGVMHDAVRTAWGEFYTELNGQLYRFDRDDNGFHADDSIELPPGERLQRLFWSDIYDALLVTSNAAVYAFRPGRTSKLFDWDEEADGTITRMHDVRRIGGLAIGTSAKILYRNGEGKLMDPGIRPDDDYWPVDRLVEPADKPYLIAGANRDIFNVPLRGGNEVGDYEDFPDVLRVPVVEPRYSTGLRDHASGWYYPSIDEYLIYGGKRTLLVVSPPRLYRAGEEGLVEVPGADFAALGRMERMYEAPFLQQVIVRGEGKLFTISKDGPLVPVTGADYSETGRFAEVHVMGRWGTVLVHTPGALYRFEQNRLTRLPLPAGFETATIHTVAGFDAEKAALIFTTNGILVYNEGELSVLAGSRELELEGYFQSNNPVYLHERNALLFEDRTLRNNATMPNGVYAVVGSGNENFARCMAARQAMP